MAADTAGALEIRYPALQFVRMPCTGKTDVRYLLEAFEQGADGVYIVACPIGNCHHVRGNERGWERLKRAKKILRDWRRRRTTRYFLHVGQLSAGVCQRGQDDDRTNSRVGANPLKQNGEVRIWNAEQETEEDEGFCGRSKWQVMNEMQIFAANIYSLLVTIDYW